MNTDYIYGRFSTDCINPYMGKFRCRQCANCLSARSREWTSRLMQEKQTSLLVVPFTLTYTDSMLNDPDIGASIFEEVEHNGRKGWFGYKRLLLDYLTVYCLSKEDVQKFIKRLRKNLSHYDREARIKYFIKGEYGDVFQRPHLHGLIYLKLGNINEATMKQLILKSWFNGIYQERGQNFPNMNHPWNWNKEIGKNPIVEFENFDEDCAKYTTKYTSKESILGCKASHIVPEFTMQSNHFGEEFFWKQIKQKRKEFKRFCANIDSVTDDDVRYCMEKIFTFVSLENKPTYFPSYIKCNFFKGYYTYDPKEGKYSDSDPFRTQITTPHWRPKGKYKASDQERHSIYRQLVKYYTYLKKEEALQIPRDIIETDTISCAVLSALEAHLIKINQANNNRIKGARDKRESKIAKKMAIYEKVRKTKTRD